MFSALFKLLFRYCIESVVCFIVSVPKNVIVNRLLTSINQYFLVSLCWNMGKYLASTATRYFWFESICYQLKLIFSFFKFQVIINPCRYSRDFFLLVINVICEFKRPSPNFGSYFNIKLQFPLKLSDSHRFSDIFRG